MRKKSTSFITYGFINAVLSYLCYQQLIKLAIAPTWFIFCILAIVIANCIISYKIKKNNGDLPTYSAWINVLIGILMGSICAISMLVVLSIVTGRTGVYPYGGGMGIPYHIWSIDLEYLIDTITYILLCTEIGNKFFEWQLSRGRFDTLQVR